ncbi:MAG: rhodanese-like domain-containing protein [Thermoanaerobaculia bacterium]|nr:rhodanese-like domain-containing protein [Thermoanaerobaculia bacterium]
MEPPESGPPDEAKRARIDALYARSKQHFPTVPDLSVEELERLREVQPVVLLDVRKPPEQEVSMIPGAITREELETHPDRYRDRPIVAYCTVGHRSGLYVRRLLDRGFEAYNLRGAILAWTHAGGELVRGEEPTRRVHVAGPQWNLAADGYEGVW